MAIDYGAMRAQGRSIGRAHGRASAEIEKERQRQQRKAEMEKRFRQLADEQAKQQNEIAKSQYAQAQAGRLQEEQLIAAAVSDGTMLEDGTYTQKHWERMAADKFFKQKRSLAEEQHFYENIAVYAGREASGAKQGFERKYSSGGPDVDLVNYKKSLAYNEAMRQKASEYEYLEGIHASIDRFGNKVSDAIFGEEPEEVLEAPEMLQHPSQRTFDTNEIYSETPEFQADSQGIGTNAVQSVYRKAPDGSVDTSTEHRVFIGDNGQLMEATSEGPIPFEGDRVNVADYNAGVNASKPKTTGLSEGRTFNPADIDTQNAFMNSQKVVKLSDEILNLTDVDTQSIIQKGIAKVTNFWGQEYAAISGEKAKDDFAQRKVDNLVNSELKAIGQEYDANGDPIVVDYEQLAANIGSLDAKKAELMYAYVKLQRGTGRFTGQELEKTAARFNKYDMGQAMAAVKDAAKSAKATAKSKAGDIAVQTAVARTIQEHGREGAVVGSEMKGYLSEPVQLQNGSYALKVDSNREEQLGYSYIIVQPNGAVEYRKRGDN